MDRILAGIGEVGVPRALAVRVARRELDEVRSAMMQRGAADDGAEPQDVIERVRHALERLERQRLAPVINATGVIIHTNLGRSPLARGVVSAIAGAASGYCNLEYDLAKGQRGGRAGYLENSLAVLCEAQAATVVNNCAAALVLILRCFAARPPRNQVLISRGELVQIGGGFRIPEILQVSGAALREVGTTNITTLADYRAGLCEDTALILKVHQSNFAMCGFAERPSTCELAALAREAGVPLVEDLGSGATFDTRRLGGGEHEPLAGEALSSGAGLVCFSGDKLLGGPQAGIIAGNAELVGGLKKDPFFRALRCDKLVLAGLEATVDLLLRGEAGQIPIRQMMAAGPSELRERASAILAQLRPGRADAGIVDCQSQVGGGSLPLTRLASVAISLSLPGEHGAEKLAAALRRTHPPVIGVIAGDRLNLDLRSVLPQQDDQLTRAIGEALERFSL